MTYKLLIVDDEQPNLRLLERLFASEYDCYIASSAAAAIKVLEQHDIAIIISDQRMPVMSGIELLKATAKLRPHMVRILLTGYTDVEALVEAINCGLVYMYFTKPWNNDDVKLKVSRARDHHENNRKRSSLELANGRLREKVKTITLSVVKSLIAMEQSRNQDDYHHALRVCKYTSAIARQLELGESEINELATAALLHGLDHFEGSFTRTNKGTFEKSAQESQVNCELRLLQSIPELAHVADMIRMQRENFDGSGHPIGLGGEQIPLGSRIIRVADEYDLMLRPHASAPMRHDEVLRFLSQRSGKQFDRAIVNVISQLAPEDSQEDSTRIQGEVILAGLSGIASSHFQPLRT